MRLDVILDEVRHLDAVGSRLEGYAAAHAPISKGLLGIAASVRNAATLLSLLVATKSDEAKPPKVQ